MSKWQEYRDEAVDFAAPYVKRAEWDGATGAISGR